MRTTSRFLLSVAGAVFLATTAGCSGGQELEEIDSTAEALRPPPPPDPYCGNGICDTSYGENSSNCSQDCYCGNGTCDSGEWCSNCSTDCGGCTCGALGQTCCAGSYCNAGLFCIGGVCQQGCGGQGQPCCGIITPESYERARPLPCNIPYVCVNGYCQ